MDSGNFVRMLLLVLQKAFDTVDHAILISKLEAIGLGHDIVLWFKTYLCDRQQLVDVSSTHNSFSKIKLMKRKATRNHSLHEKTAASVLLKLFISINKLELSL